MSEQTVFVRLINKKRKPYSFHHSVPQNKDSAIQRDNILFKYEIFDRQKVSEF